MLGIRNLAVSSGSACASATVEPSFVLRGIGVSDELAHRALRFSFGRFTTDEEIDFAVEQIVQVVSRLRTVRSEEYTSELQSRPHLVCRLLLEKKKKSIQTP